MGTFFWLMKVWLIHSKKHERQKYGNFSENFPVTWRVSRQKYIISMLRRKQKQLMKLWFNSPLSKQTTTSDFVLIDFNLVNSQMGLIYLRHVWSAKEQVL